MTFSPFHIDEADTLAGNFLNVNFEGLHADIQRSARTLPSDEGLSKSSTDANLFHTQSSKTVQQMTDGLSRWRTTLYRQF